MKLEGRQIVILAEDLYEDLELWYPLLRMREEGAEVSVVGPERNTEYRAKHGYPVTTDAVANDIKAKDVDAIIIPGGYAPDRIRRHDDMVGLVTEVNEHGGLVAFVCHGGWVPISANVVSGKKATSFFAIKDDMVNAGVDWVDQPVVRDRNLISSRKPDDLPDFCRTIIDALTE
jgi:protease I